MKFDTILFEEKDSIALITLNRPKKLNAFNQSMLFDLLKAFDHCDQSDSIKAIIITGSGRAFCAGADLSSGENTFKKEFDNTDTYDENFNRDSGGILTLRMYRSLKPIIAACNGPAVGVGATLQLAADIRIASNNAAFSFPFAKRGIAPDACSSWFLPKIVGISKALEWSYSGEMIGSDDAFASGLVSYISSSKDLINDAIKVATKFINTSSPVSIALTRQMMWSLSSRPTPEDAHKIDSKVIEARGLSEDAAEGVISFLEKRNPSFKNLVSKDIPNVFPWDESQYRKED